jgi:hypothetical protein
VLSLGDLLRKRDRVIAFRVSDEEYLALQKACLESGTQSISAFAREAVNSVAAPYGLRKDRTTSSLDSRVGRIEQALELLLQELKNITKAQVSGRLRVKRSC